jgi:hypothetical protein
MPRKLTASRQNVFKENKIFRLLSCLGADAALATQENLFSLFSAGRVATNATAVRFFRQCGFSGSAVFPAVRFFRQCGFSGSAVFCDLGIRGRFLKHWVEA